MIKTSEIIETINMVEKEHFDIRTITMGLSLFGCIRDTAKDTATAVYDLICKRGKNIVKVASDLSLEYGVPVVNKRVSVTPASFLTAKFMGEELEIALALDKAAKEIGVDFIGGYSALVHKSMTESEKSFILSIPEVLSKTERLCSSVNVGSTRAGINMDAVKLVGEVVKRAADITKDGLGAAKFVAFCNAVEDNPFMAGAFHGVGEGDCVVNVGVSGPGVVQH
ncbi:MAG: DUF711 family protein, partial [Clostridia bacterium]|nr:DUF711 family protein [Clostridia bacterium]